MSSDQQRATGSFVASAGLHTDKAVLDQIDAADCVAAADFIEQLNKRNRIHLEAIDRDRNALGEADADFFFLVWCLLRRTGQLPGRGQRRIAGIFELSALVADVPEVAVPAVNLLAAGGDRDAVGLGVIEAIFAGLQCPLSPRSDNLQLRS